MLALTVVPLTGLEPVQYKILADFKSALSTDSNTAAYENCKFQTGENSGEN